MALTISAIIVLRCCRFKKPYVVQEVLDFLASGKFIYSEIRTSLLELRQRNAVVVSISIALQQMSEVPLLGSSQMKCLDDPSS